MLTFLHAADLHLDAPFHALPPEQAAARRQEQRTLLDRLAQTVTETGAELVLLSGDLFDSSRVRPESIEALSAFLTGLRVPVFLAPGNHDPWTALSPWARQEWPDHVHIFSSPEPQRYEVPELGCVVYGSAFTAAYRMDGPLDGFHTEDEELVRFGCFHGDLSSVHSRYGPVRHNEIAASGLDYLALGHSHTASGLKKAGRTYYAWPGCPEGRGFDETGEKGVYLGRWDAGRVTLSFLPMARRRYLAPQLDVTDRDPEEALRELIAGSRPEDIVRIVLTGTCDPDRAPDLAALGAIAASFFYRAQLTDATTLSQALWARAEEDGLTGLFLRTMRRRMDEAAAPERPLLERAVRFGLAALEGREEPG